MAVSFFWEQDMYDYAGVTVSVDSGTFIRLVSINARKQFAKAQFAAQYQPSHYLREMFPRTCRRICLAKPFAGYTLRWEMY